LDIRHNVNFDYFITLCSGEMTLTRRAITVTIIISHYQQDAQLSQRDRAAGCVIVFAKSSRLELGDNILQTL